MNFIKNLLYLVFSLQEKILTAKLNKTLKIDYKTKRKKIYSDGCLLSLDSIAEEEKNKMEEELRLILKTYNYEPDRILEYIKKKGTQVFYIKNASSLYSVRENEGFIYPQKGLKALYLSFLTEKKLSMNIPEMFVLTHGEINRYYFIYHFYNWYAFKHGISGLDYESVEMLNNYLYNASDSDINKLQLSDIYKLKDAIKQDKAAIEFVVKLCRDFEGAQNALKKLQDGGTNI